MARQLPKFDSMKAFYPTNPDPEWIKREIGGDVNQPHYKNTCIIRVSRALNYAGDPIPRDTTAFRTKQGADGKWYGLRVSEFRKYMERTYGKPMISAHRAKNSLISSEQFKGYRGILCLSVDGWSDATGHVTLWNIDQMLYGHADYFARAYDGVLWVADDPSIKWSVAPI